MGTGSGVVSVAECGSVWDGCSPRTGIAHHQRFGCHHLRHLRTQTRHALEEVRAQLVNLNHVAPGERGLDWFATRSMSVGSRPVTWAPPCNLNPVALARIRPRLGTPNALKSARGLDALGASSGNLGAAVQFEPRRACANSTPSRHPERVERRLVLLNPLATSHRSSRPPAPAECAGGVRRRAIAPSFLAHGWPHWSRGTEKIWPKPVCARNAGYRIGRTGNNAESMAQRDTTPAARPLSHAFLRANRRRSRRLGTAPRPIVGTAGGRRHATTRAHRSPVRLANPLASRASGGGGPQKGTRWEAQTESA